MALISGVLALGSDALAQKLTIQGDRFAVDGTPRFLTFITYFGAMGAPNVGADLHFLRGIGFDGVRIWPNLDTGPQLMNSDGALQPDSLARLKTILDLARQEHLIVDVTFTHEHVPGMTAATARVGILAATTALMSYDNLLFDIQNERNVGDRRFMSEQDVASIFAGIKAADPARIATASDAPVESAQSAASYFSRVGLDVTAYHDPRSPQWYQFGTINTMVSQLKTAGRPVYLQEPNTTRDSQFAYPTNDRAEYFLEAFANAKRAGAAAWCFHTEVGVDFRTGPALMQDRLSAYPEPEWAFVNSLIPRLTFKTNNGVNYLVAVGGGGGGVRADRTAAGPGTWQEFAASSLNGGPLLSGDPIALRTADGVHYLQATGGGGSTLRAVSTTVGSQETFVIEKSGGGIILDGDGITLRANDTPWYVVAESGGGANAFVNSTARGGWETFTISFLSPHITDLASVRGHETRKEPR